MTTVDDYQDLGKWEETHRYECQQCDYRTAYKFDRHECPHCDTPDSLYSSTEWAQERDLINHGPGGFYGIDRVVRI